MVVYVGPYISTFKRVMIKYLIIPILLFLQMWINLLMERHKYLQNEPEIHFTSSKWQHIFKVRDSGMWRSRYSAERPKDSWDVLECDETIQPSIVEGNHLTSGDKPGPDLACCLFWYVRWAGNGFYIFKWFKKVKRRILFVVKFKFSVLKWNVIGI